ncbi:MAG: hypothetical protein ACXWU2_07130 [Allosphingosinicella sp.]
MRILAAVLLASLAAGAPAAKPPPETAPAEAGIARLQSLGTCVAAHPPAAGERLDPQDAYVVQNCECAIDRYAGRDAAGLERLADDAKPLEPYFAACRAERAAGRVATSPAAPRSAVAPPGATPAGEPTRVEPIHDNLPPKDSAGRWSGVPDLGTWLRGTGLPRWSWTAIPLLVVGVLVLLFRRRRGRDDLLGPPRAMRPPPERMKGPNRPSS